MHYQSLTLLLTSIFSRFEKRDSIPTFKTLELHFVVNLIGICHADSIVREHFSVSTKFPLIVLFNTNHCLHAAVGIFSQSSTCSIFSLFPSRNSTYNNLLIPYLFREFVLTVAQAVRFHGVQIAELGI